MTGTTQPPLVRRHDVDHVATLTLDRPEARNALSLALLEELGDAFASVHRDPSVHVVVLAAEGPAWCAGHDLRELAGLPDEAARLALFQRCSDLMVAIATLRQPVIAQVHAMATAAGCQLVATCDLAVAGESARFATPGVGIGLFCTTPMVALSRAVAPKHAMELLLTGDPIGAHEAARIGLVNRVVPDGLLAAATAELAATIAARSPDAVAVGKAAGARQRGLSLVDAYADASRVMAENLGRPDAVEGIDAFLHKRPPRWTEPGGAP
ncbi:MAG: enoyl-CoA hydratase [Acidimicrobiales bacterium]|nr:enoyl-CoA hydratase [Actinomycetota bacterium]